MNKMKKLLTIAFCAAAASVMAVDVEMGQVGLYNFTCPATVKENLIAVCFDDLASGQASIPVSNLVQTVNLAVDDELYIFNGDAYQGFVLKQGESAKYWDKITSYTASVAPNPTVSSVNADAATMVAGQGFWIVRKDPTEEVTVTVYGKPHSAAPQALVQNKRNLCGNPTNVAKFPTITNPTVRDVILIPDASGMGYKKGVYGNDKWNWNDGSESTTISPLAGFWYTPMGSETTIAW